MPLLKPTDDRLYQPSAEVTDINAQVWPHMPTLLHELNRAPMSVGLSAPQCGIMLRFFCYRAPGLCWVINPVFVEKSKELVPSREGCLSWPGRFTTTVRHKQVRVRYQDEKGVLHEKEFSLKFAAIFQHEMDHLDGKNIFPRPQVAKKTLEEAKSK